MTQYGKRRWKACDTSTHIMCVNVLRSSYWRYFIRPLACQREADKNKWPKPQGFDPSTTGSTLNYPSAAPLKSQERVLTHVAFHRWFGPATGCWMLFSKRASAKIRGKGTAHIARAVTNYASLLLACTGPRSYAPVAGALPASDRQRQGMQ